VKALPTFFAKAFIIIINPLCNEAQKCTIAQILIAEVIYRSNEG